MTAPEQYKSFLADQAARFSTPEESAAFLLGYEAAFRVLAETRPVPDVLPATLVIDAALKALGRDMAEAAKSAREQLGKR